MQWCACRYGCPVEENLRYIYEHSLRAAGSTYKSYTLRSKHHGHIVLKFYPNIQNAIDEESDEQQQQFLVMLAKKEFVWVGYVDEQTQVSAGNSWISTWTASVSNGTLHIVADKIDELDDILDSEWVQDCTECTKSGFQLGLRTAATLGMYLICYSPRDHFEDKMVRKIGKLILPLAHAAKD